MEISFTPRKDAGNIEKHGVSLALAAQLDWPELRVMLDDRKDYGEVREIGFGLIGNRLYCVVFTQRGDTMHIISMRKANSREVRNYVEHT